MSCTPYNEQTDDRPTQREAERERHSETGFGADVPIQRDPSHIAAIASQRDPSVPKIWLRRFASDVEHDIENIRNHAGGLIPNAELRFSVMEPYAPQRPVDGHRCNTAIQRLREEGIPAIPGYVLRMALTPDGWLTGDAGVEQWYNKESMYVRAREIENILDVTDAKAINIDIETQFAWLPNDWKRYGELQAALAPIFSVITHYGVTPVLHPGPPHGGIIGEWFRSSSPSSQYKFVSWDEFAFVLSTKLDNQDPNFDFNFWRNYFLSCRDGAKARKCKHVPMMSANLLLDRNAMALRALPVFGINEVALFTNDKDLLSQEWLEA